MKKSDITIPVLMAIGSEMQTREIPYTAALVRQIVEAHLRRRSVQTIVDGVKYLGGVKSTAATFVDHYQHTKEGQACFCNVCFRLGMAFSKNGVTRTAVLRRRDSQDR